MAKNRGERIPTSNPVVCHDVPAVALPGGCGVRQAHVGGPVKEQGFGIAKKRTGGSKTLAQVQCVRPDLPVGRAPEPDKIEHILDTASLKADGERERAKVVPT